MVLIDPNFPPDYEPPVPKLRAAKVKPPEDAETYSGFRWWPYNRDFIYDDLIDGPPKQEE